MLEKQFVFHFQIFDQLQILFDKNVMSYRIPTFLNQKFTKKIHYCYHFDPSSLKIQISGNVKI